MELKKLEYLESIYRLQNFTRAAEEHYISQPSITNAVRSLEEELGCVLIERKSKPLRFTHEGERFMRHVYMILNAVNDALNDMKNLSRSDEVVLNLGFTSTARRWFIPRIYNEFHSLYPGIDVALQENTLTVMMEQLLSEDLDLLFSFLPDNCSMELYEYIPLQACELGVLLSPDHMLAQYRRIPLEALAQEHLLTFPPGSLIRGRLEAAFQALRITPKFQTVSQIDVAEEMVSVGCGVTFTTRGKGELQEEENGLVFRSFKDPIQLMQCILLKRSRPRTSTMQQMISFLMESV